MRALRGLLLLVVSARALAQYVGTSPGTQPGEPPATPSTALAEDFSIYPKNAQTREQQSADLFQCYSWARGQTGFDPTQVNGGVPQREVSARREQYRRALTVCLEARGYTVHYAAPAATAPPPAAFSAAPAPPPPLPAGAPPPYFARYSPPPPPELKYHPFAVQLDGGYTATAGTTHNELNGGGNVGLGLTWFPTASLPLGLRADGMYSWLGARRSYDPNGGFSFGYENVYGGDADVQLDLSHRSSSAKWYLFGGVGEYREFTRLKQVSLLSGTACWAYYCGPGEYYAITGIDRMTSPWRDSWNAGLGAEIAIADHASFFLEARYLRIEPYSSKLQLVPVRIGFRF
jgi:opacity protein-like surface antigen